MDVLIDGLKVALLGISVTFAMLFIIVGFVKLLDILLNGRARLAKRSAATDANTNIQETTQANKSKTMPESDEEIVAAIVAAICYESGMSEDMFVLKSIRRKRNYSNVKR